MATIQEIETELEKIKERNARVEADKAWERSTARKVIIAAGTYVFAAIFLILINASNPYLTALVPAIGFIFSTLSLPFLKNWWIEKRN